MVDEVGDQHGIIAGAIIGLNALPSTGCQRSAVPNLRIRWTLAPEVLLFGPCEVLP